MPHLAGECRSLGTQTNQAMSGIPFNYLFFCQNISARIGIIIEALDLGTRCDAGQSLVPSFHPENIAHHLCAISFIRNSYKARG